MAIELFADNATTTLASSPSAGATSFTVASSSGFPAAVTGVSQFRVLIGTEIVTVTNVSGTTWTCVALAQGHSSGDAVSHVITSAAMQNLGAGGGDYFRSGYYHIGAILGTSTGTLDFGLNSMYVRPFLVPVRRSFDRLGVRVTAGGAAGAVVRLGLYGPGPGKPGDLIVDAGTVASTTSGTKEATIAVTLDPGVYWIAVVEQVATCTLLTFSNAPGSPYVGNSTDAHFTFTGAVWSASSISGALPTSVTVSSAGATTVPSSGMRAV